MPTYHHGGDIYGLDGPVLDFSANLHPLGMPPEVRKAAEQAVVQADHYPDPLCRALRKAIGMRHGVPPHQVICGSGAADLILRLCFATKPRKALVTAPTFSEYEGALRAVGCTVVHHMLRAEDQFDVGEELLSRFTPDLDVVFLCTPNNPTGRLIDRDLLEEAARICQEQDIRLVVDECFLPLTCGHSLDCVVERYPNLFLLQAFTKSYAIPGLRLGYGLCRDEQLLEDLYTVGQPWSVSTVAQAAGLAACGLPDYPARGRAMLEKERPRLMDGLVHLGMEVCPGQANYLLFRARGQVNLREILLERGILIRACGNYPGLGEDYYRVAVRSREENQRLLDEMREVITWQKQL